MIIRHFRDVHTMNAPLCLTLADFTPLVGQSLGVALGELPAVPLTLVEATPLTPHPHPGQVRDPFSLIFEGPGTVFLEQHSYDVTLPVHGRQALFLVPIGRSAAGGFRYQAVFT